MSELLASTIRGQKLGALSYADGTSAPKYFGSGLPFEDDGSIAVEVDGAIDHYHQGLPFTADGRLAVTLSGPPTRFGGGAAPFSASGQLVLGSDGSHYSGGIPFTATSAISSIAGAPPPLTQRYFTQLDGQSKYWRRIETDYGQTATATLECLFYGGSGSGIRYLEGRHSNDRFYIALSASKVAFGNGSGGLLSQTTVDLTKINHAKLVADGTSITFFVNGVQLTQVTQIWTGLLDEVGFGVKGDQLQEFYDGILVAARVTTDTVDNIYGLDTNLDYDLPDGETLGTELVNNGDFANAIGWSAAGGSAEILTVQGGIARLDAVTAGSAIIVQAFTVQSAAAFKVIVDVVTMPQNGILEFRLNGATKAISRLSLGKNSIVLASVANLASLDIGWTGSYSAGTFFELANVSVKEIPDSALIFENGSVDQSDRLLVTKNAAIGFWGEDKWFDAIKSVTGQVTVPTPDSITIDEVGGTLAGVAVDTPAAPIRVTGDCDLISGQVDISVIPALAGVAASITQSGPFSFDLVSQGALGFKRAFSGGAQATITNIKVELRYDYATGAQPATSPYSPEYSSEYA